MFAGKEFSVPSDVFNLGPVDNTTNTTCVGGLAWDPYLLARESKIKQCDHNTLSDLSVFQR
jgi:hypothetical protein